MQATLLEAENTCQGIFLVRESYRLWNEDWWKIGGSLSKSCVLTTVQKRGWIKGERAFGFHCFTAKEVIAACGLVVPVRARRVRCFMAPRRLHCPVCYSG